MIRPVALAVIVSAIAWTFVAYERISANERLRCVEIGGKLSWTQKCMTK